MRTQINKESFEDRVIKKDLVDVDYDDGFFLFTNKKIDGIYKHIGIIRCHKAYKLDFQDSFGRETFFVYDFCFEDSLPLFSDSDVEVEEGDIINIRTKIDLDFSPYLASDDEFESIVRPNIHTCIGNTYLVTFLIELDPF